MREEEEEEEEEGRAWTDVTVLTVEQMWSVMGFDLTLKRTQRHVTVPAVIGNCLSSLTAVFC